MAPGLHWFTAMISPAMGIEDCLPGWLPNPTSGMALPPPEASAQWLVNWENSLVPTLPVGGQAPPCEAGPTGVKALLAQLLSPNGASGRLLTVQESDDDASRIPLPGGTMESSFQSEVPEPAGDSDCEEIESTVVAASIPVALPGPATFDPGASSESDDEARPLEAEHESKPNGSGAAVSATTAQASMDRPSDKGEVIWEANLFVRPLPDNERLQPQRDVQGKNSVPPEYAAVEGEEQRSTPTAPGATPAEGESSDSAHHERDEAAGRVRAQHRCTPRYAAPIEHAESAGRSAQRPLDTGAHEERSGATDHVPPEPRGKRKTDEQKAALRTESPIETRFAGSTTVIPTSHATATRALTAAESAQPGSAIPPSADDPPVALKPNQVSTVQVHIAAPSAGEEAAQLKLFLSQRGDQINIRVRAFDAEASPLPIEKMQPLLHSLAEKGFASESVIDLRGAVLDGGTAASYAEKDLRLLEASASDFQEETPEHSGRRHNREEQREQPEDRAPRGRSARARQQSFNLDMKESAYESHHA